MGHEHSKVASLVRINSRTKTAISSYYCSVYQMKQCCAARVQRSKRGHRGHAN